MTPIRIHLEIISFSTGKPRAKTTSDSFFEILLMISTSYGNILSKAFTFTLILQSGFHGHPRKPTDHCPCNGKIKVSFKSGGHKTSPNTELGLKTIWGKIERPKPEWSVNPRLEF